MATPAGGDFSMMEHRTVGILYFFFGVVGVLGNLLTIVIFAGYNPLSGARGKLHITLALGNMMVVAGTPFSGSSAFAGQWLFGDLGCQLYGLETYTGGMGAVAFAILLCVQRYLSMASPKSYDNSSWPVFLLTIGWIYSIGVAVGPVLGWNSYVIESSGTACGLDWSKNDLSHRSMFIALPVFTVIQMFVAMAAMRGAFSAHDTEEVNEKDWFTNKQLNMIAVANLAIVSIGFAPYGFFSVWALFNHDTQMTMIASVVPPLMAKMSTMFYPLVYIIASKKFKDAFIGYTIGTCQDKKAN